jgi:hypothetical protein
MWNERGSKFKKLRKLKRKEAVNLQNTKLTPSSDGSFSTTIGVEEEQQRSFSSGCRFSISDSDKRRCNVIADGKENYFGPEAI